MTTDRSALPRVGARRFERLLERIVGVFGVLFALQTLDSFFAGRDSQRPAVAAAVGTLIVLSLLSGLAAAVVRRAARQLFLVAFVLYVAALVVGPFGVIRPIPASPMPWLAALSPVAVAYLVTALRSWIVSLVLSALVGLDIALTLMTVGGVDRADASVDGAFTTAVAVVLVVLLGGVRRAVAAADAAQQTALTRFSASRLDDALEAERVRTDALVHDSVLTTFLSAAAARDPESEALAVRMAGNSLRVLAHVAESGTQGPRVPLGRVLADAEHDLAPLLPRIALVTGGALELLLPQHVAEAMVTAMVQAMTNSVKHAGDGAVRTARMEAHGVDGLRIVVEDDGVGFDPGAVSPERLGVRTSIVERVQLVDGTALVDAAPGRGTRVVLTYGSTLDAPAVPDDAVAVPA